MLPSSMPRLLDSVPFGVWSTIRAPRGAHLHAMVGSVGKSREFPGAYLWDGMRRGSRPFAVLQVTMSGGGLVERGGRRYKVGLGRAMLVHVPDAHRYLVDPEEGEWTFVFALIHGQEALRLVRSLLAEGEPVLPWPVPSSREHALYDLVSVVTGGERASAYRLSAAVYRLVMCLCEPVPGESLGMVRDAVAFMTDHLGEDISIATLASAVGLSRSHFSRRFAAEAGVSPVRYLREARCERAATLLSTTALPVRQVALESGFSEANYFCRVFRRLTGLTPGQYRRMHRIG